MEKKIVLSIGLVLLGGLYQLLVSLQPREAMPSALQLSSMLVLAPAMTQPCSPDFHALPAENFQACFDYWVKKGL